MDDKIQLEIVTPKGRALVATVDEVTAPSVEGEFGVLPGHLPLLAALRTGLVSYRQGSETKVWGFEVPIAWWFWHGMLYQAGGSLLSEKDSAAYRYVTHLQSESYLGHKIKSN